MKNEIELKPSYWASVSGGKDSLYMLKLILSDSTKYPLDGVIHFEIEIDYPFIKNVVDYMQMECEKMGIKFVRIKPRNKWINLYNTYLFPTRKARWCRMKTTIGFLKHNDNFLLDGKEYKVRHLIDNTNGYVACTEVETKKVRRFYIDTEVEQMKGGVEND